MELSELHHMLAEHEDMEFPEFPDDEAFANWVDDLFEVDDYYFGLLTSLSEGEAEQVERDTFDRLRDDFEHIIPQNDDVLLYQQCAVYLASLERIIDYVVND